MSVTRYKKWQPYVKAVLRAYPKLEQELKAVKSQKVTQGNETPVKRSRTDDGVFLAATKELPNRQDQRELEAVRNALTWADSRKNGEQIKELVKLVYFTQQYLISGAADKVGYSYAQAGRLLQMFIYVVAFNLDLIEETELETVVNGYTLYVALHGGHSSE